MYASENYFWAEIHQAVLSHFFTRISTLLTQLRMLRYWLVSMTKWRWPKHVVEFDWNQQTSYIHQFMFAFVVIFIVFSVFGHIQQTMLVVMANFIGTFGQTHRVNVRRCQFSVTITDFGHIHLVIFIRVKLTTLWMFTYNVNKIHEKLKLKCTSWFGKIDVSVKSTTTD